jgi:hypothetical protein
MQVEGKIKVIGQTEQVSDKFKKRTFVVETKGQYPQFISIECNQDKTALLDSVQVGQEVTAHINLRGRAWTKDGVEKYFNSIECWKLDGLKSPEKPISELDPFLS